MDTPPIRRRTLLGTAAAAAAGVPLLAGPAQAGPHRANGLALRGADISTLKKNLDFGAV